MEDAKDTLLSLFDNNANTSDNTGQQKQDLSTGQNPLERAIREIKHQILGKTILEYEIGIKTLSNLQDAVVEVNKFLKDDEIDSDEVLGCSIYLIDDHREISACDLFICKDGSYWFEF